jgi:Mrp family chromosome partitioning ATPase
VGRLLEALRNLQQPSAAAAPRKVTPRLAASIRRAVLCSQAGPAADAEILFRVPAAGPRAPVEPTSHTFFGVFGDSTSVSDPVVLVDSIQASVSELQAAAASLVVVQEPAIQVISTVPVAFQRVTEAIPSSQIKPIATPTTDVTSQLPQPTVGELEIRAALDDAASSATYRQLLNAARHDSSGVKSPVIVIAGVDSRDASGFIAAALGTLLAREAHNSVLLIDAHADAPSIAHRYGLAPAKGLCESLAGRANRQSVIARTSLEALHVLPFGQASPHQAQQLPQSLAAEIELLKPEYGAILIDAGALSSDWALAAAKAADAVYLLVRLGETPAEQAEASVANFRAAGGKLTGCIALG